MPKLPHLRRSNRDRHAVYSSLQENSMGIPIHSALFKSLVREANRDRVDVFGQHHYSTRSRRSVMYDGYAMPDSFSPTPKSGDVSEAEPNDENVLHSALGKRPRRQSASRRVTIEVDEDEDYEEKRPTRPPKKRSTRTSGGLDTSALSQDGLDDETLNQDTAAAEEFSSLSDRVKRRRQRQTDDDEPEPKRTHMLEGGREPRSSRRRANREGEEGDDELGEQPVDEVANTRQTRSRPKRVEVIEDEEDSQQSLCQRSASSAEVGHAVRFSVVFQNEEPYEGRKYFLRQNRTQVNRLQDEYAARRRSERIRQTARNFGDRNGRRDRSRTSRRLKDRRHQASSTSSSSGDDDDQAVKDLKAEEKFERRRLRSIQKGRSKFLPLNMNAAEWKQRHQLNNLLNTASGLQAANDIEPMAIDRSVKFADIGGLDSHIQSLQEVVAFPLLYPEIYDKFKVQAPKGVLFYGPPGTGKTLIARALANECSKDGRKVSFFMRKGADCMSKWVGESERQLRMLFDQAYQMRPAIIFFDEIDGLAPVRSSRQDQIHSSIVSTLLALMDGLDNRGDVVVIGATNRLDSIDPALRRPGRFDRELRFDLPDQRARRTILDIHTKEWNDGQPAAEVLDDLAERTSGYCGADLKALCTEAVLVAVRNRYPHIYVSEEKLQVDPGQIQVDTWHFNEALRRIVPASRRGGLCIGGPFTCCSGFTAASFSTDPRANVLLDPFVKSALTRLPQGYVVRREPVVSTENSIQKVIDALQIPPVVPAARLLLHASRDLGQTRYYLNAFLTRLDHLPIFSMSFSQIFANNQPEENLASTVLSITRATSRGSAALLVLPDLDVLHSQLPPSIWHMLLTSIRSFDGFTPLLILATMQQCYDECSDEIRQLFKSRNAIEIHTPIEGLRRQYFDKVLEDAFAEPKVFDPELHPKPQKADATEDDSKIKLTESELKKLIDFHEQMKRQFRIFLRDLLGKLIRDRRFSVFNLPVSTEDAEDYYEIIENPMSLSEMMGKIDKGGYENSVMFLDDIRLITANALEYNPANKMEDIVIRHNAAALTDTATALFDAELDEKFEEKLNETARIINENKERLSGKKSKPDRKNSKEEKESVENGDEAEEEDGKQSEESNKETTEPMETEEKSAKATKVVQIDMEKMKEVVDMVVLRTANWPIQDLEAMGVQLLQQVQKYRKDWDRAPLAAELYQTALAFERD